jgi:rhomboid family GlyGly-CTERM serine protease
MANRRFPILTLGFLLITAGLHWFLQDKSLFYFSARDIVAGEIWRVVTGHFMHADMEHLLWNCLGLAVLGTLIEIRSRRLLWAALVAGMVCVSILLLSPFSQLEYYCGLSGVLNALLLVALWQEWRATRSWLIIAIVCGSVAKVVIEVSLETSLLTHISWPPYAWSHVAGLFGGSITIWGMSRDGRRHWFSISAFFEEGFRNWPVRVDAHGARVSIPRVQKARRHQAPVGLHAAQYHLPPRQAGDWRWQRPAP